MFKAFFILVTLLFATPALAQSVQCADRPSADSSNACANTRFVQNHGGGGSSSLTLNHIFVGNGSNIATDVAMTGDCSIVFAGGAITCTKSSGSTILAMAFQAPSAVSITGGTITGLPSPTLTADAATKGYVDTLVASGRPSLAPVRVATIAVLSNTPTYANGAAGVGATLTAGSVGILTVDGTATVLNDRILVKNQASAFQNGPYFVSTEGTAGVAYILTRVTDADTAAELPNGLTMLVTAGTTNTNSSWSLNQPAAITVGTTALPFIQTGGASISYWTLLGNDIYNNNTSNVGVGSTTPLAKFNVQTNIAGVANGWGLGQIVTSGTSDSNKRLAIGYATTENVGFVQAYRNGTGQDPLYLNPAGGNVGIGVVTPAPIAKIDARDNVAGVVNGWGVSQLALTGLTDSNKRLAIGYATTENTGFIQAYRNGVGYDPLILSPNGGVVGIGTGAPDLDKKLQVIQGSGGAPITVVSHAVQITRNEQLASPLDTQGGQNAALDVVSSGANTSVVGTNIAQPVAIRGTAVQTGSGDSVGIYASAFNNGTGTYAAFGGFLFAQATTASTGAIGLGLGVDNSSGVARPFALSGSLLFVGVDAPCSGNAICSSAYLTRSAGQLWDAGYAVQSGSVATSAFVSPGFRVDPSGNETALTNTATSDERLKDIHGPFNRGLAEILQINPILYNWKEYPGKPVLGGVSAQDVQRVIPEAVSEVDTEGHLGVSDRPLVAALINSVKELKATNDSLRACQSSWRCRLFGP